MPEKTSSFLKSPQTWIIVILLAVIAAFAFSHFNKPKPNRLQQAAAYFDAIEAEERAEAEKEKARLAEIEAAKAAEEKRIVEANVEVEKLRRLVEETAPIREKSREQSRYQYANKQECFQQGQLTTCMVTCQDQYGSKIRESMNAGYNSAANGWNHYSLSGTYGSLSSVFQAVCSSK